MDNRSKIRLAFVMMLGAMLAFSIIVLLFRNTALQEENSRLEKNLSSYKIDSQEWSKTEEFFMKLADNGLIVDDELSQDDYWGEYWQKNKDKPSMTVLLLESVDEEYGTNFLSWIAAEDEPVPHTEESKAQIATSILADNEERHKFAVWLCMKATDFLEVGTKKHRPNIQNQSQLPDHHNAKSLSNKSQAFSCPNTLRQIYFFRKVLRYSFASGSTLRESQIFAIALL